MATLQTLGLQADSYGLADRGRGSDQGVALLALKLQRVRGRADRP